MVSYTCLLLNFFGNIQLVTLTAPSRSRHSQEQPEHHGRVLRGFVVSGCFEDDRKTDLILKERLRRAHIYVHDHLKIESKIPIETLNSPAIFKGKYIEILFEQFFCISQIVAVVHCISMKHNDGPSGISLKFANIVIKWSTFERGYDDDDLHVPH